MVASLLTGGTSPSPIRPPSSGMPITTTTFEVSDIKKYEKNVNLNFERKVQRLIEYEMFNWSTAYKKLISSIPYFIFSLSKSKFRAYLLWISSFVIDLRLFVYSFCLVIYEYRNMPFLLKGVCFIWLLKPNFFCILFNIAFKHGRKTLTFQNINKKHPWKKDPWNVRNG